MSDSLVGRRVELDVGPVAHGGHCVARWDNRVVFVRHALPDERVTVEITEGDGASRFLRGDAVEVLTPAAGRVEPPCPLAGPGRCGGCDFQHVDETTQRDLLGRVVSEQLSRLGGIERRVQVEPVTGGGLLGWRTRIGFALDEEGRPGLRRHRSHQVIPVPCCPIGHPGLPDVGRHRWPGKAVEVVVSSEGERLVVAEPGSRTRVPKLAADGAPVSLMSADGHRIAGRGSVSERVHDRTFRVSRAGFWQVHPGAATTLVDAVLEYAVVVPGQRVADLYAGVGLFSAFVAQAVGPEGSVLAVEADGDAVRDAKRNLHDLPQVTLQAARVERAVAGLRPPFDTVVLDPPRVGARAKVVAAIAGLRPSRVVYVACDPAALARDLRSFGGHGYELSELRAFAMFPMTHHVECVALLRPRQPSSAQRPQGASSQS